MIDVYDFLSGRHTSVDTSATDGGITAGHGGGDTRLMQAFVRAVATGDRSHVLSGPQETLETHLMVFAAERARREGRVVSIPMQDA